MPNPFDSLNEDTAHNAEELWEKIESLLVTDQTPHSNVVVVKKAIATSLKNAENLGHLVGYRDGNNDAHEAVVLALQDAQEKYKVRR